jgi:hypothetical protein
MHEHNHLLRNIIIFGSFFAFLFICWVVINPTVKEQMSIFKAESQEEVEEGGDVGEE